MPRVAAAVPGRATMAPMSDQVVRTIVVILVVAVALTIFLWLLRAIWWVVLVIAVIAIGGMVFRRGNS